MIYTMNSQQKKIADVKTFETNNINLTDVTFIKSQLEPEQYVELKYPEAPNLNKIFFLDKDGVLKYDDVNGVPVDESDVDFGESGAYEATVFNYTEDVDPELKKEIQDKYQKERDEILKNYNKDITFEGEEGEFTPIPDNVTGQQLKEEHNSFYQKEIMPLFNAYLEETYDQNDRLGIFEEEENEILTEFIKTPKIAAIIKAYNVKNSPVEDKEDYILDFKGIKTDTSKASIDDLKALITKIENEIESLKNNTATDFSKNIIELETELTNLRGVIKGRAQKKYTPEQKAAIDNVKKLQALNKKSVEAGVELPADDPVTGLKKGAIAYRINGKFHRRVSNVVEKLKKEGYKYTSEQDVRDAYSETIEVKGLTNDSVDKFIADNIISNANAVLYIAHINKKNNAIKGMPSSKLYDYIKFKKNVLLMPSDSDFAEYKLSQAKISYKGSNEIDMSKTLTNLISNKDTNLVVQVPLDIYNLNKRESSVIFVANILNKYFK